MRECVAECESYVAAVLVSQHGRETMLRRCPDSFIRRRRFQIRGLFFARDLRGVAGYVPDVLSIFLVILSIGVWIYCTVKRKKKELKRAIR